MRSRNHHGSMMLIAIVALITLIPADMLFAQRRPATFKEFLAQYRGKEVLMMDKTGGVEQFVGGEAAKAYTVVLNDVMNDYIIVSRQVENDKRSFIYQLTNIRRIIFAYDGKPYQKIVLEMY